MFMQAILAISTLSAMTSTTLSIPIRITSPVSCLRFLVILHYVLNNFAILDLDENIYRWLSATIPSRNYNGALKARMDSTGVWFINGARFTKWKSDADFFIWVSGTRKFLSRTISNDKQPLN